MKILYIASADSYHSYKWIKYFADKSNNISWITTTPPLEKFEHKNIKLLHISNNFITNLLFIKEYINETKPDILHAHYAGKNGLLGALTGFNPYVITAWGSDILFAGKHPIKKWAIKYALSKTLCITCDSEIIKSNINNLLPLRRIHLINFGVDTDKFNPHIRNNEIWSKYGISPQSIIVLSLRNFETVYDIETLIKSASIVSKYNPNVKFVLAGKGNQETYLRQMVQDLHLFHIVKFIGFIPNDKLPTLLNSSDIYVSTSLSDAGIAESTAEAMSCEKPVIITDVAENNKWITNTESGFLIPPSNEHILADCILWLARNSKLRKEFGVIARQIILERNDYYKEMDKMDKIYKGLINEH